MNDKAYIHSTYINQKTQDAVVVSEKDLTTGKKSFNIIRNPSRSFWITRKGQQCYQDKREYAHGNDLDQYKVKNSQMTTKIAELLGKGFNNNYTSLKKLCDSPYVYGADINVQGLVKMAYVKQQKVPVHYTVGSLDIETSVLGGKEVILITFIDQYRKIYTSIYKPFLQGISLKDALEIVHKKLNLFYEQLPSKLLKKIQANPFSHEFFESDDELEIIKWIFQKIHKSQIDFITIWNMGFDIPYLLDRIRFRQGNVENIMSHPDIPRDLRKAEWYDDKAKIAHFTDRWDWFTTTSHTQFLDAMCLYSRIRKVKGRDISYKLDYISNIILQTGKLKIGNTNNHHVLQESEFPAYIAYNIVDVILMILMEEVNEDVTTLCSLIGNSNLADFNKQTVQLKNMFYEYCRNKNCVPGTVGSNMMKSYDSLIPSSGGAVLSPKLARNTGVAILEEFNGTTALHKGVLDIDVSSQYPSITAAFNISKETKLSTCLDIEGFGITNIPLNQAIISLLDLSGQSLKEMLLDIHNFILANEDPKLEKVLNRPVVIKINKKNKATSLKKIMLEYQKSYKDIKEASLTRELLLKAKAIIGENQVEDLFSNLSAPKENAIHLCNKYFNLPNYTEMEELINLQ